MWIGASIKKRLYGYGATNPHRTVQRRHSASVERIGIGARFNEASHRRRLCRRIPCTRTRETISGIVKGFGTTAIPRANLGTHTYQLSRGLFPVSGGCEVQCGIARIDIVADLFEVIGFGRLASCSPFEMS